MAFLDFADWLRHSGVPQDLHGAHAALSLRLPRHTLRPQPVRDCSRIDPRLLPQHQHRGPWCLRPWVPEVTLVHNQAHELEQQRRHLRGTPSWRLRHSRPSSRVVLASLPAVLMVEAALWLINVPDRGIYDGDSATVWWLKPIWIRSFRIQTAILFKCKPMPLACRDLPLDPGSGSWPWAALHHLWLGRW